MNNQNHNTDRQPRDDKGQAVSQQWTTDRGQDARDKDHDKMPGQTDRNRQPQEKGRGSHNGNQSQGRNAPTR